MAVQVSKTLKSVGATVEMLRLRFAIVGRGIKAPKNIPLALQTFRF